MERVALITTTFSSTKDAKDVAVKVLNKRLAACIQLSAKIQSFYWWEDAIEQSDEYLLTMKTRESIYPNLEEYLKSVHPYETPEILCEYVDHTEKNYLRWLVEETKINTHDE